MVFRLLKIVRRLNTSFSFFPHYFKNHYPDNSEADDEYPTKKGGEGIS